METTQKTKFLRIFNPGSINYPGKSSLIILCLLLLKSFFPSYQINAQYCDMEKEVLKAYQMRTSGDISSAREMLETVLKKDSTNALANFEMARTVEGQDKWKYIDRAIHYDPENPMYVFYKANMYMLDAYVGMQRNDSEAIMSNVENCCKTLHEVLEINPGCKESLLFLVDLYGNLPEEMGGNPDLAEKNLETLRSVDQVYAVEGEIILAGNTANPVECWEKYIADKGECKDAIIRMGKANLMNGNIEKAEECFNKIIAEDPSSKELYLEIARAHIYKAMRGGPDENSEIDEIIKYINKYLASDGSKPVEIEAWCYGWLSRIEQRLGNDAMAEEYMAKASELTENIPMYTALPKVDSPPNLIAYHYNSYFKPF